MLPVIIDCWADNMKLGFDNKTRKAIKNPGVDIRVPGFGNTNTVEWLNDDRLTSFPYFANIVNTLVSWGYQRGKDVVGAPYDWRHGGDELEDFYIRLRTLIEMVYRYNNNKKVIVLGHSMGNPLMNFFYHNYVDQDWKDKYIKSHVSLAGAWGGSMQIVDLFASGYNMNLYRIILSPYALRGMQRTFTSSAFLFPSSKLWAADDILGATAIKNYTLNNIKEFFEDIDWPIGYLQYLAMKDALILEAPGVQVECLYGEGIETPELFKWRAKAFPDSQPSIEFGNGDGTVNIRSLKACDKWHRKNNAGKPSNVYNFTGIDHMGILTDSRVIETLKNILYFN